MALDAPKAKTEVLGLPSVDRVACPSLDSAAEAAWDALADQREQELARDTVAAVPLEVAVARLDARFTERR
jgi:hypothetical protein